MKTHRLRLLTIIAEDTLEEPIIETLRQYGVTGYTLWNARGMGSHQSRTSAWEGENVQFECLTDFPTADRVTEELSRRFLDRRGFVLFLTDVEVLRADKFRGAAPQKENP